MKSKYKKFLVNLDDDTMKELELISLLEGCSIGFIIRTVLKDYLTYYLFKNKPKND